MSEQARIASLEERIKEAKRKERWGWLVGIVGSLMASVTMVAFREASYHPYSPILFVVGFFLCLGGFFVAVFYRDKGKLLLRGPRTNTR